MKLGVISDTHNFFDPQIPELFRGVEHILHAGDIGSPAILQELQLIAPVTAVSGNTDDPGFRYALTQTLALAGHKFLLHHIVNPHRVDDRVQELLARHQPDVVVFGHSHKPFSETLNGTFFFNPGYAGKSRFGMARTLAVLHCGPRELRPEFLPL